MNISGADNLSSIRQAMGMVNLRSAMNQDAQTVDRILQGLEELDEVRVDQDGESAHAQKGLGSSLDTRA